MSRTTILAIVLALVGGGAAAHGAVPDAARIEQLTGSKGTMDEAEGVFKVTLPRSDLKIEVAGVHLTPPMGLTCWAAFKRAGEHTVVMGDQVLTQQQVSAVMDVALENGLEVTALHNHFFWDSPRVVFMHVGGMGDEGRLAAAIGKLFAKVRETSGIAPRSNGVEIDPARTSLDPAKIEGVLGRKGRLDSGVYKVTIGRTTKMAGHEMGNAMGVNTWAAFAGSDERAVVDGDFAMDEDEVQDVLKALRSHDINVVAIHNHMIGETPRVVFLHFWGVGPTAELAGGIKAANYSEQQLAAETSAYEALNRSAGNDMMNLGDILDEAAKKE